MRANSMDDSDEMVLTDPESEELDEYFYMNRLMMETHLWPPLPSHSTDSGISAEGLSPQIGILSRRKLQRIPPLLVKEKINEQDPPDFVRGQGDAGCRDNESVTLTNHVKDSLCKASTKGDELAAEKKGQSAQSEYSRMRTRGQERRKAERSPQASPSAVALPPPTPILSLCQHPDQDIPRREETPISLENTNQSPLSLRRSLRKSRVIDVQRTCCGGGNIPDCGVTANGNQNRQRSPAISQLCGESLTHKSVRRPHSSTRHMERPRRVAPSSKVSAQTGRGGKMATLKSKTGSSLSITSIHRRNRFGETQLHVAVMNGDMQAVRDMIRVGACVNLSDYAGWTPLHEAVNIESYDITKTLLQAGALVNCSAANGTTPLHDAIQHRLYKITDLLLKHGADPVLRNMKGEIPIDINTDSSLLKLVEKYYPTIKAAQNVSNIAASQGLAGLEPSQRLNRIRDDDVSNSRTDEPKMDQTRKLPSNVHPKRRKLDCVTSKDSDTCSEVLVEPVKADNEHADSTNTERLTPPTTERGAASEHQSFSLSLPVEASQVESRDLGGVSSEKTGERQARDYSQPDYEQTDRMSHDESTTARKKMRSNTRARPESNFLDYLLNFDLDKVLTAKAESRDAAKGDSNGSDPALHSDSSDSISLLSSLVGCQEGLPSGESKRPYLHTSALCQESDIPVSMAHPNEVNNSDVEETSVTGVSSGSETVIKTQLPAEESSETGSPSLLMEMTSNQKTKQTYDESVMLQDINDLLFSLQDSQHIMQECSSALSETNIDKTTGIVGSDSNSWITETYSEKRHTQCYLTEMQQLEREVARTKSYGANGSTSNENPLPDAPDLNLTENSLLSTSDTEINISSERDSLAKQSKNERSIEFRNGIDENISNDHSVSLRTVDHINTEDDELRSSADSDCTMIAEPELLNVVVPASDVICVHSGERCDHFAESDKVLCAVDQKIPEANVDKTEETVREASMSVLPQTEKTQELGEIERDDLLVRGDDESCSNHDQDKRQDGGSKNKRASKKSSKIPVRNINKRNSLGETNLHLACKKGDLSLVQALIEAGINVNQADNAGWTALHEASAAGYVHVVEKLLCAGADVTSRGLQGLTPLHDAVQSGHYEVVKLLLQYGSNPQDKNALGQNALDCAYQENIKELLSTFNGPFVTLDRSTKSQERPPLENPDSLSSCSKERDLVVNPSSQERSVTLEKSCSASNNDARHSSPNTNLETSPSEMISKTLREVERTQTEMSTWELEEPEVREKFNETLSATQMTLSDVLLKQQAEKDNLTRKYRIALDSFHQGLLRESLSDLAYRQKHLLAALRKQNELKQRLRSHRHRSQAQSQGPISQSCSEPVPPVRATEQDSSSASKWRNSGPLRHTDYERDIEMEHSYSTHTVQDRRSNVTKSQKHLLRPPEIVILTPSKKTEASFTSSSLQNENINNTVCSDSLPVPSPVMLNGPCAGQSTDLQTACSNSQSEMSAPSDHTKKMISLIREGVLIPGHDVLELTVKSSRHKASLLDDGSIRDCLGKTYLVPEQWIEAVSGNNMPVSPTFARKKIMYKSKSLWNHTVDAKLNTMKQAGTEAQRPNHSAKRTLWQGQKETRIPTGFTNINSIHLIRDEEFLPCHIMNHYWDLFTRTGDWEF